MQYDLVQFLKDHVIQFNPSVNAGWINIPCPFCGDRGEHGGFNLAGGYYTCFRCGGHSLPSIASRLLNCNLGEAKAALDRYEGRLSNLALLNKKRPQAKHIDLPGGDLEPRHRKYLRQRGFSPAELVRKYGIRGTGLAGEWAFRIIIPIVYQGQVVSYQGRDITGKQELRYKTLDVESSIVDPKSILYGMDRCLNRRVGIVEGVFDQWRLGDNVAATLGTSMTEAQLGLLAQRFTEVVFLFDPELEAQERARRQGERLAALGVSVEVVDTELDHDPGDMTPEEAQRIKREVGLGW